MNPADVIDNIAFTTIRQSKIHGLGLFAENKIAAGQLLGYLDGQEVPWSLHQKYNLTCEWNALTNELLLVRPYRTKYSFINHSRQPNVKIEYQPLRVVAIQNIDPDEELTLDYRREPLPEDYINNHGQSYL